MSYRSFTWSSGFSQEPPLWLCLQSRFSSSVLVFWQGSTSYEEGKVEWRIIRSSPSVALLSPANRIGLQSVSSFTYVDYPIFLHISGPRCKEKRCPFYPAAQIGIFTTANSFSKCQKMQNRYLISSSILLKCAELLIRIRQINSDFNGPAFAALGANSLTLNSCRVL